MKSSVVIFVVILTVSATLCGGEPDSIIPYLKAVGSERQQPFAGEIRFLNSPQLSRVCSVEVLLTAAVPINSSEYFRLNRKDDYLLQVVPDTLIWEGPIDSGATFSAVLTFLPTSIGTYEFNFGRRWDYSWQSLAQLVLAFDEDGKTLYAGSGRKCMLTNVPLHSRRNVYPIVLRYPRKNLAAKPINDRHFTAQFAFLSPPSLKDTTIVEFELECQYSLYSKVQFVLDHSTNLKVSDLSESWGNRVGTAEKYRYYKGSFSIVPRLPGLYFIDFKIIGKHSFPKRNDRITTHYPIYFVIDQDNELKIIGNFNPWERYKQADDPMLGTVTGLVEMENRQYRLGHVRSLPDFISDELKAAREPDSTNSK